MKKLIAMGILMMMALCVLTMTASAEAVLSAAVLESGVKVEASPVTKVADKDNGTQIEEETAEADENADAEAEEADEIEMPEEAELVAELEAFDFDTLPVHIWADEQSDEQTETTVEEELLAVEENDIEGLEIEIIDNPAEALEEGVVLIDEDEEEAELTTIEDDEAEELTMEDDVVPLAGPAMVATDRRVNVRSDLGECVNENDLVTLTGELVGFEGCDVLLQWQVYNGSEWENIEGANDMAYCFPATSESVNSAYRLAVAING